MKSSVKRYIKCSNCLQKLPIKWLSSSITHKCPKCGFIDQTIEIAVLEKIDAKTYDNIKGKVKDFNFNSKKNPRYEFFEGYDLRKKDKKWMYKRRIIDKYNNRYIEKVIDIQTSKVIHNKKEPLSAHIGHGSAKFKHNK